MPEAPNSVAAGGSAPLSVALGLVWPEAVQCRASWMGERWILSGSSRGSLSPAARAAAASAARRAALACVRARWLFGAREAAVVEVVVVVRGVRKRWWR